MTSLNAPEDGWGGPCRLSSNILTPLAGLQIFSQLAEFSHFGTDFAHFWDQCKSAEKKIRWGWGVPKTRLILTWKQFYKINNKNCGSPTKGSVQWSPPPQPPAASLPAAATAHFSQFCHQPFGALFRDIVQQGFTLKQKVGKDSSLGYLIRDVNQLFV